MIDHVTLLVSDIDRSLIAYRTALAPLGYEVVMDLSQADYPELPAARFVGLGVAGKPDLWLRPAVGAVVPTHAALRTRDRAVVDAFHRAALSAGMRDHGAPGLRAHYHPSYYGAFVLDADGYNLEVVCHEPLATKAPRAKRTRRPPARRPTNKVRSHPRSRRRPPRK